MKKFLAVYVALLTLVAVAVAPAADVKIEFGDLNPAKQKELLAAGYNSFATTLPSLKGGESVQFDTLRSLLQAQPQPQPQMQTFDPLSLYRASPFPLLQSGCVGGNCQRR